MTLREYYIIRKHELLKIYRIGSIVCSGIFILLCIYVLIISPDFVNTWEVVIMFVLSAIAGNLFVAIIMLFASFVNVFKMHRVNKFYNSIPLDIRKLYGFRPGYVNEWNSVIFAKKQGPLVRICYSSISNKVEILLLLYFESRLDILDNPEQIQLKYKREKIILTDLGLCRNISYRKWKRITSQQIKEEIDRLIEVAKNENVTYRGITSKRL